MEKVVRTDAEILRDIRSAGLSFVGYYMEDLLLRTSELEDKERKKALIEEYYQNQIVTKDSKIGGTTTRVNSVIRIIKADKVVNVLKYIDGSNSQVSEVSVKKAKETLTKIQNGVIVLPKLI